MSGGSGNTEGERIRHVHDLRLVPSAFAAWLTSFGLVGARPAVAYAFAAGCGVLATCALLRPKPSRRERPVTAVAAVAAALAVAAAAGTGVGLRLSVVTTSLVRSLAAQGARVPIEVVLTGDPQSRPGQGGELVTVRARAETLWPQSPKPVGVRVPVLVLAGGRSVTAWRGLLPGHRVRFMARLTPPRHAELLAAIALVRGPPAVLGRPSAVQRAAAVVRAKLRQAADVLPAAQRGVLPAMVVGDTSRLDPHIAQDYKVAGLTHTLVVSGANLAIVIGAVLAAGRAAGQGRRVSPLIAALAVSAFVVVARPEPSVLRATVMGLIGLLALVSGRERHGVPALAAAVVLLVLIDPELARSYGFALSVLATGGLLVLAPPWRNRMSRWMPRPLAEVLAVTAAAQVTCAPVLVMLTGQLSMLSIAANLLAAPAIAPATLLGALAALVAPFSLPSARLLVLPAGLAVGWIVTVARAAASIPHATLQWRDGALGAALLIAVALLAALTLRRRRWRRVAAAALAGLLIMTGIMRAVAPGWPPRGWLFVTCDVGQGDAHVLAAGPGSAVVVDTGPDPGRVDRCLRDLGIVRISLLVLTHPHADHIGGMRGALRGRMVETVLASPLSGAAESRLLPGRLVHAARPGQRWMVGRLTLSVLGPPVISPMAPPVSGHDAGTLVNNVSVVLMAYSPGLSVLLTGDVENEAQQALASRVPRADIVKVAHHGSVRQDGGFLAATRASIAIISVGAGNDYGHPAPGTLALLRRLGMCEYRTDRDGDIAVLNSGGRLTVVTRGT